MTCSARLLIALGLLSCHLHVLIIHMLSNMFPQALRVTVLSGVNTAYCYIIPFYSDKTMMCGFSNALFC